MDAFSDAYSRGQCEGSSSRDLLNGVLERYAEEDDVKDEPDVGYQWLRNEEQWKAGLTNEDSSNGQ
jgi:hypothetical protein